MSKQQQPSHEWSAPTVGDADAFKKKRPTQFWRLFWWYFARAATLFSLIAVLVHTQVLLDLENESFIPWHLRWSTGSASVANLHLGWQAGLALPLILATIFYFVRVRVLRVIAYGASALSGCYFCLVTANFVEHYQHTNHTGFFALFVFDLIAMLFCVYSALHLTAEFLLDMQRRQAAEHGLLDPKTAAEAPAAALPVEPIAARRRAYLFSLPLRLLAALPLMGFAGLVEWMWQRQNAGWSSSPWYWYDPLFADHLRIEVYVIVALFSLAVFLPNRTGRLVGSGAAVVMGIYTIIFTGIELVVQDYFLGNSFRWHYEGAYVGVLLLAILCIFAAVVSIRQTVRIYRPERFFLPGREDLEEFEAMGRWDEGGGKSE